MERPEYQLNVLWAAESDFRKDGGIKAHSHDYYHMFLVLRGPLEFHLNGNPMTLEAKECLIAKPGVSHGLKNNNETDGGFYELKFTAEGEELGRMAAKLPERFCAGELEIALMREILQECGNRGAHCTVFASVYAVALLRSIYRSQGESADVSSSVVDIASLSEIPRRIVLFLEDNNYREVPLQEIADHVEFNKNYICSLFKKDAGVTIGGCQMVIRIHRAAELISFSDMSLTQVAVATGFTNVSHFNRIFKRVVGLPPGQYRRLFTANALSLSNSDTLIRRAAEENPFIDSVLHHKPMSTESLRLLLNDEPEEPLTEV